MSPAIGVVTILERVTVVFPAAVTALITVIKSTGTIFATPAVLVLVTDMPTNIPAFSSTTRVVVVGAGLASTVAVAVFINDIAV